MGIKILVFILLLGIIFTSEAKKRYRHGFIDGKPLRDHYADQIFGQKSVADCMDNPGKYNVSIFNFEQPQDHFDPDNTETWLQQVQYRNDNFVSRDDGDIVFLMIGGESPVPTSLMCFMNWTWGVLAKEHGAFMFQLEHRYFGNSTPTPDMSVENLKYLTTEQAMADINNFIPAMNKKFNFNKPKWVAFGGSYPGTISALLRMFYPNITNGNIASSAPLWAKVDFWEYANKMEQSILWESQVNASAGIGQCWAEVRSAFEDARNKMYTQAGQQEYNQVFNIQPPLGTTSTPDLDSVNFLSTIFGSFQGIIQYTFDDQRSATENRTYGLNVANLCKVMIGNQTDEPPKARKDIGGWGSYAQRLKEVYDWEQSWDTPDYKSSDPFDNNYYEDIAAFQNTSFLGDQAAMRGWMWLSCNEFGWLQTTDNNGIFQDILPLNFYLKQCQDFFNMSIDGVYVQNQVDAAFQKFGLPQNYRATNVVLPNGSLDPWSTLGANVTVDNQHQYARTTIGGAHCVDMYPYDPSKYPENSVESKDVNATIQLVKREVAYYLTLPSPYGDNGTPNSTTNVAQTGSTISLPHPTHSPAPTQASSRLNDISIVGLLFLIGLLL